jgi:hypothetical protein
MENSLSKEEIEFLIESLGYTKQKFEAYNDYPSPQFKKERIDKVNQLIQKLRETKKELEK